MTMPMRNQIVPGQARHRAWVCWQSPAQQHWFVPAFIPTENDNHMSTLLWTAIVMPPCSAPASRSTASNPSAATGPT